MIWAQFHKAVNAESSVQQVYFLSKRSEWGTTGSNGKQMLFGLVTHLCLAKFVCAQQFFVLTGFIKLDPGPKCMALLTAHFGAYVVPGPIRCFTCTSVRALFDMFELVMSYARGLTDRRILLSYFLLRPAPQVWF